MNTLKLTIDGMSCSHCLQRVQRALGTIPGVQITSVQIGRASVEFDPATQTPQQIADAVSATGYKAQVVG